jgi:hypothetical protein
VALASASVTLSGSSTPTTGACSTVASAARGVGAGDSASQGGSPPVALLLRRRRR